MSVIRSLTSSRDCEERDREKANLENDFKQSDGRLNKYVVSHHSDLTFVMQAYSKISSNLVLSKTKLKEIREKLITCQQLLHCKRDELKKLYLESMENKFILELLDQVENVCQANSKTEDAVQIINDRTEAELMDDVVKRPGNEPMNLNFDLNEFFIKKRLFMSTAVQMGNQLISNKQNPLFRFDFSCSDN